MSTFSLQKVIFAFWLQIFCIMAAFFCILRKSDPLVLQPRKTALLCSVLLHSALKTWSRVLQTKSWILILMLPILLFRSHKNVQQKKLTFFVNLGTSFIVFQLVVEGKNWVVTHVYYVKEMFFVNYFFSRQLFLGKLKFILKSPLVRTLWSFQGVKKVSWKKSYSPFSFPGGKAAVQIARAQHR